MTNLKMTREEQLELENIQLKLLNAQRETETLQAARIQLQRVMFERLRIPWDDAQKWLINIQDGTLFQPDIAQTPEQKSAILRHQG